MAILDRFKKRVMSSTVLNAPPNADVPRDDDEEKKNEKDETDPNEETSTTNPAIEDSSVESEDPDKKEDDKMSTSTPKAAPDSVSNPATATVTAAQPVAATFAELSAMCDAETPNRDTFIVSCLQANMTLPQAQSALNKHCIAYAKQATEKAAMASRVAGVTAGAPPVPTKTGIAPGVSQKYAHFTSYKDLVNHFEGPDGGELDHARAVMAANKYRPDLREQYVGRRDN